MTSLADHADPSGLSAEHGPLILDGRHVAAEMRRKYAEEVQELAARYRILPGLAVVRVGQDPASVQYAERIVKSFGSVGLAAAIFELPANASRAVLHAELEHLKKLLCARNCVHSGRVCSGAR